MKLKKLIKKINKENAPPGGWREGDKLTSSQARSRRNRVHKPRVQACSSFQAPEPGNRGTSVQAGPGHKLPGQKYFFYA